MNEIYVALKLEEFDMEADTSKMAGYLPAYHTLEDLREEYPDADYMRVCGCQLVSRKEIK